MSTPMVTGRSSLIERAKNIILTPRAEWDRIAAEPANTNALFVGYLLPLAVLSAVCATIGWVVFGVGAFGFTVKMPLMTAVVQGVVQVVMALVGAFILAFVIDALAPTFGSVKDMGQAQKLAVYSGTAGMLAGVFMIFPPLAILGLLGIYSLVLLYLGLPRLMKTPEDKRIGYFLTIIVVCIVLGIVAGVVMGSLRMMTGGMAGLPGMPGASMSAPDTSRNAEITLPGGGTLNVDDLEKAANQAANGAASGQAAVDPARVQALLPGALPGGFTRTSVSSGAAMSVATAEGEYTRGDSRIQLTLTHMGGMGGLAAMAGAAGVQSSSEDADGYERVNTVNGRMVTERVRRGSNSATYQIVGRGVAIEAEGSGVSIDDVRNAVNSVGVERLEQALTQ